MVGEGCVEVPGEAFGLLEEVCEICLDCSLRLESGVVKFAHKDCSGYSMAGECSPGEGTEGV